MKVKIEKVYVVNLDDRMHRWELFEKLDNPLIHRKSAVDTRKNWFAYEDYGLELVPHGKSWDHYFTQSKGAVGCYLSHYEIWSDIVENDIKWALVLEDDASIDCVKKYLENNGEVDIKNGTDLVQLNDRTQHSNDIVTHFNGTTAYLANYKSAKILKNATHDWYYFEEEMDDVLQWRVDTIGLHDCPELLRDSIPGKYCWQAKNAIRLAVDRFIGYNGHKSISTDKRLILDYDPRIKIHESNVVSDVTDPNEKYFWEMNCDELYDLEQRHDYMWWQKNPEDFDQSLLKIRYKCEEWCNNHRSPHHRKCSWLTFACSGCEFCDTYETVDNELWKIKDFEQEVKDDSLNLIVVFRNEELILPYFIDYYKKMNIDNFIFIDNNSTDESLNYILERNDINSQIHFVQTSYRDNLYGVGWVNKILKDQFKNKWCVVVDVDELILLPDNKTLTDIKSEMINSDSNVLQTLMVDFYPNELNKTSYEKSSDFLSHSNYNDKLNLTHNFVDFQLANQLTVKGGLRHRITHQTPPDNSSVCLTKKSFFYYDFYDTHYLSEGMHWFKPNKFKSWAELGNEELWINSQHSIKFYKEISLLGHFKYLKPDIKNVFEERIIRGEDWSGLSNGQDKKKLSVEYIEYANNIPTSFFDKNISKKYSN